MTSFTHSPAQRAALIDAGYVKRARVKAALAGQPVDRPPVAFWHHFACQGSPAKLAAATTEFFVDSYDLDIVKVMHDLPYPFPRGSVANAAQWELLDEWADGHASLTNTYCDIIRRVRREIGDGHPLMVTMHSPLTLIQLFAKTYPQVLENLAENPAMLHRALSTVAINLRNHARACIAAGADGIFLSMVGCDETIPLETYHEIGRPYDLMVFDGARAGWLNIAHLHGGAVRQRLEDIAGYPVAAISWSSLTGGPSLSEARAITDKCLMGGWHERDPLLGDLENDTTAHWAAAAQDAVAAAGAGLILTPGCSVPNGTAQSVLQAMRRAADHLG